MRPTFLRCALIISTLLAPIGARAQFFSQGEDPGRLRWYRIETPNYQIIYPEGTDSLARVYGSSLEYWREATGRSIGAMPNEFSKKKIPVVLHTHYTYPNASMFWAPRRMDIFTVPDPYGADPTPWETILTTHEPRHASQLQAGYRGIWKPLNWILGEMWPAAVWSLFPSQALSEGDAVVFETAVTGGSRARTADFLNYYDVALSAGERRSWYEWRYGSFRRYTPDYYKVGYMTVAGLRVFYDDPLFMKEYFDHIIAHPFSFFNLQKQVRRASGKKFLPAFDDIQDRFHEIWEADAAARAPFLESERLTPAQRYSTDYESPLSIDGSIYAIKRGLAEPPCLIRISPEGMEQRLAAYPSTASSLYYDENLGRLYWSENVPDPRWSLGGTSRICYYDIKQGKTRELTRSGRLFNPHPSADGRTVVAAEYPVTGGSSLVVISAEDGTVLRRTPAPAGVQLTEIVWLGDEMFAIALSDGGYGILDASTMDCALPFSVQKVVNLRTAGEGLLEFVSDRTGKNELYTFNPVTGEVFQETSFRFGATDFAASGAETLCVIQETDGKAIHRLGSSSLLHRPVSFTDVHSYPVEDALSRQEEELSRPREALPTEGSYPLLRISEPVRYRKLPHLMHFHSWAPIFFDYDEVSSLSGDLFFNAVSPGLTGLFQNTLGTSEGFLGYSAYPSGGKWYHDLRGKITYKGLYPVIEASGYVSTYSSWQYRYYEVEDGERTLAGTNASKTGGPAARGDVSVYIPLSFSRSGIHRGIIPRISYTLTNSWFNTGTVTLRRPEGFSGPLGFSGYTEGKYKIMQAVTASLRAYSMLGRAPSQTYPRWGIGAEAGFRMRPGITGIYAPDAYGYLYGYLPGFTPVQGLRLSAMSQFEFREGSVFGENVVNTIPRGIPGVASYVAMYSTSQVKFTADYAIPVYVGDISLLSPVAYIKNFLLIPHVDFSILGGGNLAGMNLFSAGADITAGLANLAWFPFDCSVGVSLNYIGGSAFQAFEADGFTPTGTIGDRLSASLVFSMDI